MYNGSEVDMLSCGDADSILVTRWVQGVPTRVLIDGGNKGDFGALRAFLASQGVTYLNSVVCTHPHDDHAGGLLELARDESIGIGHAYIHVPQKHVDTAQVNKALKLAAGTSEADSIRKSLSTVIDLVLAFAGRTTPVPVTEPFAGTMVEFLTVVGPSLEYYEQLIAEFSDPTSILKVQTQQARQELWNILHDKAADELDTELPENPETTPENNTSVILGFIETVMNHKYLFTADAGVPALQKASEAYDLTGCNWMQIPHHGSRHNINPALIKNFSPKHAWVSADGNKKHPRPAVVNAFKAAGAKVCSTHYPHSGHLWKSSGTVPQRTGYGPVVPLYEAPLAKAAAAASNAWLTSLLNAK